MEGSETEHHQLYVWLLDKTKEFLQEKSDGTYFGTLKDFHFVNIIYFIIL
jgi:hypothetical protein